MMWRFFLHPFSGTSRAMAKGSVEWMYVKLGEGENEWSEVACFILKKGFCFSKQIRLLGCFNPVRLLSPTCLLLSSCFWMAKRENLTISFYCSAYINVSSYIGWILTAKYILKFSEYGWWCDGIVCESDGHFFSCFSHLYLNIHESGKSCCHAKT